ncbi:poly(R)-hydroxyalkanoic acid synthase, class III, PhaE subunit [Methylomagnum ishizawai]|uniref:Poly(3-hydroxyalkanoate) polymerase subunit PhaE n=1 Tax=Methylomagnum ishizawai TaxID=1760988 RepID=A0A1Y6CZF5_9GAMM|nr:class III poly(R)-hydroxyalkanoic acid synthase subunit PhaE [Methylomagnum ishizawai]SMF93544.1 poly(R)-hydroxyalkanoic acid synthase, class III, PhaE subunit [Methylomagnum ishizawai]
MSSKASSDPGDWTAVWADAQQKYWQSWLDLSQQAAATLTQPPEPPPNPWTQAFDFWAKLMPQAAPPENRDWIGKLTALNKGYLQMGEHLWKTLSAGQNPPPDPQAWWEMVSQGFKSMQNSFAAPSHNNPDPWAGFATFWGMPIDNWRRVCSAYSAMPGDIETALRGFMGPGAGTPETALSRWLSLPTLGYTREAQEEMQRLGQLWLEHSRALREYAGGALAKVSAKAGEALMAKLHDLAAQGKTPESLREFYNLWVDCGEDAYAALAPTPEFTQAQARMVNTLLAAKRQEQKMVDEFLSAFNMPTRRELDTSHQRIHQLQRQVWRLQEDLEEAGIAALREEVAGLRRELEALRADSNPSKGGKPPRAAQPTA